MIVFAKVDELQKGWRVLSEAEEEVAETLLKRASAQLLTLMDRRGVPIDVSDEVQMINLETVTCNVVRRVLDGMGGVQSASQGIGSTNASITLVNPDMSLYLSKSDKDVLGLNGKSTYRAVKAHDWSDDGPRVNIGEPFSIATLRAVENG